MRRVSARLAPLLDVNRTTVSGALWWSFWSLVALAVALAAVCLASGRPAHAAVLEALTVAALLGFIANRRKRFATAVVQINESERTVTETRLRLTMMSEHLHALHDFSQALSVAADSDQLCRLVTEAVVEEFGFDSCQFWIADSVSGSLVCASHCGHDEGRSATLFSDTLRPGSEGYALHQCMKAVAAGGTTVIVADAQQGLEGLAPEVQAFVVTLDIASCVLTPLVSGEGAVGVISAERIRGNLLDTKGIRIAQQISSAAIGALQKSDLTRISSSEHLLAQSVSAAAGNALVKLQLFREMEHRVEQGTAELRSTQQAVLEAREMVIHSEKLSSLGRMAAGVIHEINDPLNFLVNILPDLRRDIEALARARQLITQCCGDACVLNRISSIEHAHDLDSHLRDMDFVFSRAAEALNKSTRIAQGLMVFTSDANRDLLEEVDLPAAAQATADLIPAKVKGHTVFSIERTPGIVWRANRGQIEQVFMNLFTNAIDAMGQTGAVAVKGVRLPNGVQVRVSDTGPGIPEGLRDRIFHPFFTTKPAGKGTGLGLTICAEIVRKFGGLLTVDPATAGGCTFVMTFNADTRAATQQG